MLRKSFIIFLLQTIVYNISIAQKDSLNYTSVGSYGIFHYELNKKEISKQKFYQYLAKNDVALKTFKSGKKIINTGNVLAYAGGFMIGYNIRSALFLKKKDYTIGVVGLCLAGLRLVSTRLRDGSLVAPFELRIPSPYAYFLVYPESSNAKPAFRRFPEWLQAENARG